MQTWHCFAWLTVTAVALYYAKWPILIITGLIGFFRGRQWLSVRFPRTMFVILAIVRGLMGGRRAPKNRNSLALRNPGLTLEISAYLSPKGRPQRAEGALNYSLIDRRHPAPRQSNN
jgi:uncharacterized membrane protein (UPF0136 family)